MAGDGNGYQESWRGEEKMPETMEWKQRETNVANTLRRMCVKDH